MNLHDQRDLGLLPLALLALACTSGTGTLVPAGGNGVSTTSATPSAEGSAGTGTRPALPGSFAWNASAPLIAPVQDDTHPILSVKDPTVVYVDGLWHVFATTANTAGAWSLLYLNFKNWDEAGSAQQHYLDLNPRLRGYHAAPQVFYFEPQAKWYLIFQSGQPQYSTSTKLSDPQSWSQPIDFFSKEPVTVVENKGSGGWLDFWVICDETNCHLFFTDDNGSFYRSDTPIERFPAGFGEPKVVMQSSKQSLFEGSSTYRVQGMNLYLTLIEAFGPAGNRYYRSFVAEKLTGDWTPLADTWQNPFAGFNNVAFGSGSLWTRDISHGELLREGYDQTLSVDPENLRFLFQGVDPEQTAVEYFRLPYRLGLLSSAD